MSEAFAWNLPFWLACGIAALIIAWPERAETVRRRRLPTSTYFSNELGFSVEKRGKTGG